MVEKLRKVKLVLVRQAASICDISKDSAVGLSELFYAQKSLKLIFLP